MAVGGPGIDRVVASRQVAEGEGAVRSDLRPPGVCVVVLVDACGHPVVVEDGADDGQAALDLADSGFKVHLIQKDSSLGGTMVMLDKTFPTGDCAMCMISPKMVEIGRHQNVDIHTLSQVTEVSGEPGNFTVKIKQQPRYVDPDTCTGCGVCEKKCPKLVVSEFEQKLTKRKAIYSLLAQAVPNTRVIDYDNCLFFQRGRCKACEKLCDANAINFEDTEKEFEIKAGAIILSPGLDRHDPTRHQELGFGRWPNVISSIQFERILSASGPFMGEINIHVKIKSGLINFENAIIALNNMLKV